MSAAQHSQPRKGLSPAAASSSSRLSKSASVSSLFTSSTGRRKPMGKNLLPMAGRICARESGTGSGSAMAARPSLSSSCAARVWPQ